MKILIAVHSCHDQRHLNDNIRDTWMKNADGVDVRFFIGAPVLDNTSDEIFLNIPDTYAELWQKTLECIKWAYIKEYDYLFKCDNDTYVHVPRLLASEFEKYDYIGNAFTHLEWKAPAGGAGYWLSKKAMKTIIDNQKERRAQRCEDWWVYYILRERVSVFDDARYTCDIVPPALDNNFITCHHKTLRDLGLMKSIHEGALK